MDERERRIGLNEALFREVNEAVSSISKRFDTPALEIVCECGDVDCSERIPLTSAEYEEVRRESDHFAVKPGHELPDVERVVASGAGYLVVEKTDAAAAELAERTDPRSD